MTLMMLLIGLAPPLPKEWQMKQAKNKLITINNGSSKMKPVKKIVK